MVPVSNRRLLPEAPYLAAAAGRKPSRIPVWFMRQAGRSLPEYRALRAKNTMMQACFDPALICEIRSANFGWSSPAVGDASV